MAAENPQCSTYLFMVELFCGLWITYIIDRTYYASTENEPKPQRHPEITRENFVQINSLLLEMSDMD